MYRRFYEPVRFCVLLVLAVVANGAWIAPVAMAADSLLGPLQSLSGPTVIFSRTFDTDTATTAATLSQYGGTFTAHADVGSVTTGTVTGGRFQINHESGDHTSYLFPVTLNPLGGSGFTVSADVGATAGSGSGFGGIVIGNRAFTFFPGFSNGAFRVYGFNPATGLITSPTLHSPPSPTDTPMGFLPDVGANVMHHWEITTTGNGVFNITVTDGMPTGTGLDTTTTFNYQFPVDPVTSTYDDSFAYGPIGFVYLNGNTATVSFDNFMVIQNLVEPPLTPEPSTVILFALLAPVLGVYLYRRRRSAAI